MPVRDEGGLRLPTKEDLVIEIAQKGISYASKNKQKKDLEDKLKVEKASITDFIHEHSKIFDVNGNHLEITAPAGDGLNEVFVQLQKRESFGTVDNVIDALREKLGSVVDSYVTKVEVLHENALESMFNNGLITKTDVDKLITKKTSEVLIVKVNKKSKS